MSEAKGNPEHYQHRSWDAASYTCGLRIFPTDGEKFKLKENVSA